MYTHRPLLEEQEYQTAENRQTAGLLGIVVILVLLIVSLFLVQQLRASAALQDCLLAGRHHCDGSMTRSN